MSSPLPATRAPEAKVASLAGGAGLSAARQLSARGRGGVNAPAAPLAAAKSTQAAAPAGAPAASPAVAPAVSLAPAAAFQASSLTELEALRLRLTELETGNQGLKRQLAESTAREQKLESENENLQKAAAAGRTEQRAAAAHDAKPAAAGLCGSAKRRFAPNLAARLVVAAERTSTAHGASPAPNLATSGPQSTAAVDGALWLQPVPRHPQLIADPSPPGPQRALRMRWLKKWLLQRGRCRRRHL